MSGLLRILSLGGWLPRIFGVFRSRTVIWVVFAAFALGSASGLYVRGKFDAAAQLHDARAAIEVRDALIRSLRYRAEQVRQLDAEIETQHSARVRDINDTGRRITREIYQYDVDPQRFDAPLARGVVRMLNDARRLSHADGTLPAAAGLTDAESRAPSAVTERAAVDAHADCAIRYARLAAQHDALVEWLERHRKIEESPHR